MQFRCLLAGVAVLLCAAGCSGDGGDALPVTTTSAAETTTTSAPTTSTTLDFETEVKLAALELLELRNEVLMNPDPARVSEYIAETCVCLERERQFIEELAATGERWTNEAIEPLAIRLDRQSATDASLLLIARQPPGSIAGPAGAEPIPEVELAPHVLVLLETPSGWRLNGLEGISMERSAAEAVIASEGLP